MDTVIASLLFKNEAGDWCCASCDYSSKSSSSVREHVESRHVSSQGFPCLTCAHVCPTRKALKMHMFRGKHYQ